MYKYKITTLFFCDWNVICKHVFSGVEHSTSFVSSDNYAIYGFDTPQTPADLGPLVKVELLPSE